MLWSFTQFLHAGYSAAPEKLEQESHRPTRRIKKWFWNSFPGLTWKVWQG